MESLATLRSGPRLLVRTAAVDAPSWCAALGSALATLAFAWLALYRYGSFNSTAYDLGFFDQVVWQIAQGRPGLTSYLFWYDFFGQHFEPVLYLFGGLYRFWADPRLLLVGQTLAVGAAAWLLYLCARQILAAWPAAGIAAAFLFAVPLHDALAFDFHPEVMGCLPLFAGLWFALKGRSLAAAACWATLLLFKEDEALILPALALLLYLLTRRRAPSLALSAGGVAWALIVVGVLEPHWRHGFAGDLTRDYAAFGGSLGGAAVGAVLRPLGVARQVFGNGGAAALAQWTLGLGAAPLIAPLGLLAAAPELLLQLASRNPAQHALHLHYGVEAVPLVYAFLLLELRWLRPLPRLRGAVALAVPLLTLIAFLIGSPFRSGPPDRAPSAAHLQAIQSAIEMIPPHAALRADSTLAAHLSRRSQVYEFPGPDWGAYVVLDSGAFHPGQAWDHGYSTALAALPAQGYQRIYDREGVQVWRR